jgi:ligand-binding SRPBCC domain-containing protein
VKIHRLERSVTVPRPLEEVFPFFAEAANLEELTPPWLAFEIVTPRPIEMAEGTLIDYRLRVRGIPMRWRSEITVWDPPHRFVDEQRKGPYRLWRHEHRFEALSGTGDDHATRVIDRVDYAVLFDLLVHPFVRRDVETIFDYRGERLRELFGVTTSATP